MTNGDQQGLGLVLGAAQSFLQIVKNMPPVAHQTQCGGQDSQLMSVNLKQQACVGDVGCLHGPGIFQYMSARMRENL
jgi:hypothetical protein